MKNFSLRFFQILFLLSVVIDARAQTCNKIDLTTFNKCYSVTISTIADDLSGVCYNYDRGTLFGVINGTESVREIDLNGNEIRNISLSGFWDTEGIAYMGNNEYALTEEQNGRIVFITIPDGNSNTTIGYPGASSYIQMNGSYAGNKGLEGVAYNYISDSLYMVKEKNNIDLYGLHDPLSLKGTTQANNMVFDLQALAANYPASPNLNFTDAAGLSFTPYGTLLILTEEGKSLIEVDASDGTLLSYKLIPAFMQPEGVIAISASEFVIVGEPNELYFYSNDCSAPMADSDNDGVPDATDNCPTQSNSDQLDINMNGIGDHCDGTYACSRVPGNNENRWIGPMIGYWYDDPCHWSKGSFPTPCDDVVIDIENTKVVLRSGSNAYGFTIDVSVYAQLVTQNNAVMCIEP